MPKIEILNRFISTKICFFMLTIISQKLFLEPPSTTAIINKTRNEGNVNKVKLFGTVQRIK
ncbi:hypothetical protein T01_7503 [Trichinella spiralis]|uniref:Uncharacterized protein n=1 Tax=Trichinella spiralis TaxID=6334 RepID=A0A0V1BJW0_TRISP|nr:hypothetical protein T01_7503 [Trichinella spiralis]